MFRPNLFLVKFIFSIVSFSYLSLVRSNVTTLEKEKSWLNALLDAKGIMLTLFRFIDMWNWPFNVFGFTFSTELLVTVGTRMENTVLRRNTSVTYHVRATAQKRAGEVTGIASSQQVCHG